LEQVRQAAQHLVEDGYLLAEDLELLVDQAAERFGVAGLHVRLAADSPIAGVGQEWLLRGIIAHTPRRPPPAAERRNQPFPCHGSNESNRQRRH
jgi:hypothetical protein